MAENNRPPIPPIKGVTRKEGEKRVIRIPPPSPPRKEGEQPGEQQRKDDKLDNGLVMYEDALERAKKLLLHNNQGITHNNLIRLINGHIIDLLNLLAYLSEQ